MNARHFNITVLASAAILCGVCLAENIDPYRTGAQYGWSENAGWLNLEPGGDGVQVESSRLIGWVWAENIGWINLHCINNATCAEASFGVVNNGSGLLSGFAWSENAGWINFDPVVPDEFKNQYRVRIDSEGKLNGWAWGENIGWIHFDNTQSWDARACIVTLEDLLAFADYWLGTGTGNLNGSGVADMQDFAILSDWWQDFCPAGWPLK